MQFLGQLRVESHLLLMFMCENDPGCCEQWDALSGGNAVLKVSVDKDFSAMVAPSEGITIRDTRYGGTLVDVEDGDYLTRKSECAAQLGTDYANVLGQFQGEPDWLQADETPACSGCGRRMQFVAQLEQGPEPATEMNFGGLGRAYVFDCTCGSEQAKFLWQC